MTLDSDARRVLDAIARAEALGVPPIENMSPGEARRAFDENVRKTAPTAPEVGAVENILLDRAGAGIPARLYRPRLDRSTSPVVLYFQGGGWVLGGLESHDAVCRLLAVRGGFAVLAVDYRKAPEHKFPDAVDDAVAALRWVAGNAAMLGLDADAIAVAGDSSGGNLATVASLIAGDGGPEVRAQALAYPATDALRDTASLREFANGYGLTAAAIDWCYRHYLRDEKDRWDWRCSPIRAEDLTGAPGAFIAAAGYDPLRDEVAAYAERLAAAGVAVDYRLYEGQIHGFLHMGGVIREAHDLIAAMAEALASALYSRGRALASR